MVEERREAWKMKRKQAPAIAAQWKIVDEQCPNTSCTVEKRRENVPGLGQ